MSKLLKTLAKIGLVELEAEDLASHENAASPVETPSDPPQEPDLPTEKLAPSADMSVSVSSDAAIDPASQRPLQDIYREAGVPVSPFPAEKLLRILDGLRAMDANTRKAAVAAMDAADDDWAVDDAVDDASHKINALQQARAGLEEQVKQALEQARVDLADQDHYQQEATASIRKQIADLEALLQRELEKVGHERTAIQTRLQQTKDASAHEATRLENEIRRLQEVVDNFATAPQPSVSKANNS